jgi:hypothetical protein
MSDLSALQTAVASNTTVEGSAVTLIQGLAAQIQANLTDPVALASLVNQLNTSTAALANAITVNTPSPSNPVVAISPTGPAPSGPVVIAPGFATARK